MHVRSVCLLEDSFSTQMRARKASLSNQSFQTLGDNQLYGSDVSDLEVQYIFTKDGHYSRVTYTSSDTLLDSYLCHNLDGLQVVHR